MKQWIGRWLVGVSVLHTLFAIVAFRGVYSAPVSYTHLDVYKRQVSPLCFLPRLPPISRPESGCGPGDRKMVFR